MEKAGGIDIQSNVNSAFANPDDERAIQGITSDDLAKQMYMNQESIPTTGATDEMDGKNGANAKRTLADIDENDIEIDDEGELHGRVEAVFGRKVALGLIAADWKIKEMAIKHVHKKFEKAMAK